MSESGSGEKKTSKVPGVIAALLIVLGVGGVALNTFSTMDEIDATQYGQPSSSRNMIHRELHQLFIEIGGIEDRAATREAEKYLDLAMRGDIYFDADGFYEGGNEDYEVALLEIPNGALIAMEGQGYDLLYGVEVERVLPGYGARFGMAGDADDLNTYVVMAVNRDDLM